MCAVWSGATPPFGRPKRFQYPKACLSCGRYACPSRLAKFQASTRSPTTTAPLTPQTWLDDNKTKITTYIGSSETELLRKLTEHLPSAALPATGRGAGASGEVSGRGPGSEDKVREKQGGRLDGVDSAALVAAEALIDAFDKNVDVARLLRDIRHHAATAARRRRLGSGSQGSALPPPPAELTIDAGGSGFRRSPITASVAGVAQTGGKSSDATAADGSSGPSVGGASKPLASSSRKSREEVEAEAAKQGASGG